MTLAVTQTHSLSIQDSAAKLFADDIDLQELHTFIVSMQARSSASMPLYCFLSRLCDPEGAPLVVPGAMSDRKFIQLCREAFPQHPLQCMALQIPGKTIPLSELEEDLQFPGELGFLAFSKETSRSTLDRIYVKAEIPHLLDLGKLLIQEILPLSPVSEIKLSAPRYACRDDNIVILLRFEKTTRVLETLKELQRQHPQYFSNQKMRFKKMEAPGIATINGLGSSKSFGHQLVRAISSATKVFQPSMKDVPLKDFREQILEAFVQQWNDAPPK
jgi:hypothetical protein